MTLDDAPLASIGGSRLVGRRSLLGIVFDYHGASLEDFDDVREIIGFGSIQLGEDWYLGFYAFTGLTDSSADWGGGLSITTQLRPPRIPRHAWTLPFSDTAAKPVPWPA